MSRNKKSIWSVVHYKEPFARRLSPGVACLGLRHPPSRGAAHHPGPLPARPGTRSVDPFVPEGWLLACLVPVGTGSQM